MPVGNNSDSEEPSLDTTPRQQGFPISSLGGILPERKKSDLYENRSPNFDNEAFFHEAATPLKSLNVERAKSAVARSEDLDRDNLTHATWDTGLHDYTANDFGKRTSLPANILGFETMPEPLTESPATNASLRAVLDDDFLRPPPSEEAADPIENQLVDPLELEIKEHISRLKSVDSLEGLNQHSSVDNMEARGRPLPDHRVEDPQVSPMDFSFLDIIDDKETNLEGQTVHEDPLDSYSPDRSPSEGHYPTTESGLEEHSNLTEGSVLVEGYESHGYRYEYSPEESPIRQVSPEPLPSQYENLADHLNESTSFPGTPVHHPRVGTAIQGVTPANEKLLSN
jgi:hypothetical protein